MCMAMKASRMRRKNQFSVNHSILSLRLCDLRAWEREARIDFEQSPAPVQERCPFGSGKSLLGCSNAAFGRAYRSSFRYLALTATTTVLRAISAAPPAGVKRIPAAKNTPAATGIATML